MDIDKFRSQWDDPEFAESFARSDRESPYEIVQRLEKIYERAQRWRKIRRIAIKVSVGTKTLDIHNPFRNHEKWVSRILSDLRNLTSTILRGWDV
jgi:hypothetical protein